MLMLNKRRDFFDTVVLLCSPGWAYQLSPTFVATISAWWVDGTCKYELD